MALVKNLGDDTYEVKDFLQSMPLVSCKVKFVGNDARVIERTNTCDATYDRHAIQAVQFHLITGMVN